MKSQRLWCLLPFLVMWLAFFVGHKLGFSANPHAPHWWEIPFGLTSVVLFVGSLFYAVYRQVP